MVVATRSSSTDRMSCTQVDDEIVEAELRVVGHHQVEQVLTGALGSSQWMSPHFSHPEGHFSHPEGLLQ